MKIIVKTMSLTALVLIAGCGLALAQPNSEKRTFEFYNGFEGRWEGKLAQTPAQVFLPQNSADETVSMVSNPDAMDLAISITKAEVKVYLMTDGNWTEIKRGTFHLYTSATNAVLFSITYGGGADGWVETWNFTLTHKERDSLDVVMTRAVNNFPYPADYFKKDAAGTALGRFFQLRYGDMKRADTTTK